jgi:hypothetical protein
MKQGRGTMSDNERIELPKDLLDRVRPLAGPLGFDSVEDLICHLLERVAQETDTSAEAEDKSKVIERLRDLGYL